MLFLFFFVVWSSFSSVLCLVLCALCALVSNNFRAWTTDFTVLKFRVNNDWGTIIYTMNGFFSLSLFSSLPIIIWLSHVLFTDLFTIDRDILGVATLFYILISSLHEALYLLHNLKSPFLSEDFSRLCHRLLLLFYWTKRY